jgi:hypothetical protein
MRTLTNPGGRVKGNSAGVTRAVLLPAVLPKAASAKTRGKRDATLGGAAVLAEAAFGVIGRDAFVVNGVRAVGGIFIAVGLAELEPEGVDGSGGGGALGGGGSGRRVLLGNVSARAGTRSSSRCLF